MSDSRHARKLGRASIGFSSCAIVISVAIGLVVIPIGVLISMVPRKP